MKLPAKAARRSHVNKDVDVSRVAETDTGTCDTIVPDSSKQSEFNSDGSAVCKNESSMMTAEHRDVVKKLRLQQLAKKSLLSSPVVAGIVPESSQQSAFYDDSSAVENANKNESPVKTPASPMKTTEHHDVVKKLRLHKLSKESLPSSTIVAGHLQNIAKLGAECLGDKAAKVTYVGSGLMTLPSPVLSGMPSVLSGVMGSPMPIAALSGTPSLLAGVTGSPMLSYTLYHPFTDNGQSPSGSQLSVMSSPQLTESQLSTRGGSAVQQTLSAADSDLCTVDTSVIDTEVVETVTHQSSLNPARKHCQSSPKKLKQTINAGSYLLNYTVSKKKRSHFNFRRNFVVC